MKDSSYSNWFANNCHVISKPLNCIKEKVSSGIMFLKTAKEILDTIKEVHDNEKNFIGVLSYVNVFSLFNRGRCQFCLAI